MSAKNSQERNFDAVIFDLDGTLLDTLDDLTAGVNYCMKKYGCPLRTRDEVRSMVGNGVSVLMEKALPGGQKYPQFAECSADFSSYYKEHMLDATRPFDGVPEMLDALKADGYLLAIVSNKFDAAVKGLNRNFFAGQIPVAIGESPSVARKPAPDTVFRAMEELNASPETTVYVGDSEVDIQTAANAGIPCISVSWGFKSTAFLKEHGAAEIADTPAELLQQIRAGRN